MESVNKGEHVVAAFLDVEKAFDNVWHNGLRYKIFMLDLPTKMTRWLSDFLVGRVIQVNVNGFLSDKISPIAGVPHGSVLSPLLFLTYVNDLSKPHHRQNSKSQFADDTALWAASKNATMPFLRCPMRLTSNWVTEEVIPVEWLNSLTFNPITILKTKQKKYKKKKKEKPKIYLY